MCRDGDGQDGDDGRAADDDAQSVGNARRERVSTPEADECTICLAHARQRVVLAAVDDELGSSAENLDELRAQVSLGSCPTIPSQAPEAPRNRRYRDSRDEQSRHEYRRRDRKDRGRHSGRHGSGRDRDERRGEAAQIQALERINVADHPADEIALPVRLESCWCERLDPLVEADPHAGEDAKGQVV